MMMDIFVFVNGKKFDICRLSQTYPLCLRFKC